MKIRIGAAVLVMLTALVAPLAHADGFSFVGSLDPGNPNDVFITSFTLAAPGALTVQTWGFGGTSNAPGGTNAAGAVIAGGGFDPYVSLFKGAGASATFIGSNDDGLCPPGHAAPACADSTFTSRLLAAGTYTLALTLPYNFSFAENYGSGTLGDGFIGLDASFDDGSCADTCSSAYAVDISYAVPVPVPEPATWALLLGAGPGLLALARRRAARPAGTPRVPFVNHPGVSMSSKSLLPVFAAVAAALVNVAFVAPAHAQVKAALVRDVDRSTAQPVNASCEAVAPSSGAWAKCLLYNVPAGKRLVVETVSYQAYSQAGTPVTQIVFGLNDPIFAGLRFPGVNTYHIHPMVTYDISGVRSHTGTQALRIYIDENQSFAAANAKDGAVNLPQGFAFSGYLIDK